MTAPALYRTTIGHRRQAPVHHEFEFRSYSWYVDVDELPQLPWWLRPFARFEAEDHFDDGPADSLRQRVDECLAAHDIDLGGGTVTAALQPRVLGYVFNPLSLYWCHDATGRLRYVIAEVHNTYGDRHAYVIPAQQNRSTIVPKAMYVSPFNGIDGHYRISAPLPGAALDVVVSLYREGHPPFVATMRGERRQFTPRQVLVLQLIAPLAPLMGTLAIRFHGILLWLRGLPVVPRRHSGQIERAHPR
ncbi:DUF1365 family protein [Mycobacterium sp. NPDC006124]|uniref:DUF1365 domain-containing protein n=1 Tax=Mycobacterium sp. NPDC006124 TaxID=3156729 RepID=UPI0033BBD1CC